MNLLSKKSAFIPNRKHLSTGFTLIELIMTIVVTSIISIPLSLLLIEHTQSVFQSHDDAMAVQLGRDEMERVNNTSYEKIRSVNFTMDHYHIIRSVTYAQGSADSGESLKKIKVEVKRPGSLDPLVTFLTYVSRNVQHGVY